MQYTTHYNLNLPEGTDIVNPLIQDNPNYSAIDTALYDNKLRVIGSATELSTGTLHALTRADQDIPVFKFVATSDYHAGDTFTVDGVSVTARLSNGVSLPEGSYKINSTVVCELQGTLLNVLNVFAYTDAVHCMLSDGVTSVESAITHEYSFTVPSGSTYGDVAEAIFNAIYYLNNSLNVPLTRLGNANVVRVTSPRVKYNISTVDTNRCSTVHYGNDYMIISGWNNGAATARRFSFSSGSWTDVVNSESLSSDTTFTIYY